MYVPAQRLRIGDGRVELDGSQGEGGGQIVRTACALSALTGVSCRISHIRARRSRPGLRAQHCTALKGLARLCDAKTSRLKVGATEVIFSPGTLRPVGTRTRHRNGRVDRSRPPVSSAGRDRAVRAVEGPRTRRNGRPKCPKLRLHQEYQACLCWRRWAIG